VLSTKERLTFFSAWTLFWSYFHLPLVFFLIQTFSAGGLWGYTFSERDKLRLSFFLTCSVSYNKKKITVLLSTGGDGGRGGPLSPLGLGGQPNVIKRIGVQPVKDILVADGQAPVILMLKGKGKWF
jgi:hypothetical protein